MQIPSIIFKHALVLLVFLMPQSASAWTIVQVLGLFHIVVGILLVFTLAVFATGVSLWVSRLNTWPSYRETAIITLEWAVAMLFVLILLVALVYFVQRHSATALTILGVIVIIGILIILISIFAGQKEKKPDGDAGGGAHGGHHG
ncbi:MAG: hypothetical protein AAB947_00365 [Patescibacteria group bacterium]